MFRSIFDTSAWNEWTTRNKIWVFHLSLTKINWDELAASWFPERGRTLFVVCFVRGTTMRMLECVVSCDVNMCAHPLLVYHRDWLMITIFACTFGHVTRMRIPRDLMRAAPFCRGCCSRKFPWCSVHFSAMSETRDKYELSAVATATDMTHFRRRRVRGPRLFHKEILYSVMPSKFSKR